jgi:4-hydroxy-3-methylbut-2-en-1-yl diphosphate synthase IspG/GcpE
MNQQSQNRQIKRIAPLSNRSLHLGVTESGSTAGIPKMTTSGGLKIVA